MQTGMILSALMEHVETLEGLVRDLKLAVADAGNNKALATSAVIAFHESIILIDIKGTLADLEREFEEAAEEVHSELASLLREHGESGACDADAFWRHFSGRLDALGATGVNFREKCFHRPLVKIYDEDDYEEETTLFHEVCSHDPPVYVVKKLMKLIPPPRCEYREDAVENDHLSMVRHHEYNHLAHVRRHLGWEYPLHDVLRFGGSIDLVKFLIDSDIQKTTLSFDGGRNYPILQLFIENKDRHGPEVFSQILQHLVLSVSTDESSPLLHESFSHRKLPLKLLWDHLKIKSGLSSADAVENDDFVFLLKATCYHHCHNLKGKGAPAGHDEKMDRIEQITLPIAFLVCSPCLGPNDVCDVLHHLVSVDSSFLLKIDSNGNYPIHNIVQDSYVSEKRYLLRVKGMRFNADDICEFFHRFKEQIVRLILRIVPQCARLVDGEGRLPLHIATDIESSKHLSNHKHLHLVSILWEAYPEGATTLDEDKRLPPFALSLSREGDEDEWGNKCASLSSAFFLLRKQPDVILGCASNKGLRPEVAPVKRQKIHP